MKLNVGCGTIRKEGYVNIDLYRNDYADIVHDLKTPLPYSDVKEIYASHIVEHFTEKEIKEILLDWHRVLGDKGKLEIKCPDLKEACKRFYENTDNNRKLWKLMIYGGQEDYGKGEYHKNGFTKESLTEILEEIRFKIIKGESKDCILHFICEKI